MPDGLIIHKIKQKESKSKETKIDYLNSNIAEMLLISNKNDGNDS
jgi:hypothetical protein